MWKILIEIKRAIEVTIVSFNLNFINEKYVISKKKCVLFLAYFDFIIYPAYNFSEQEKRTQF